MTTDHETITLIGGPYDGHVHAWDGGDYLEVIEQPATPVRASASPSFKELFLIRHLYVRARYEDGRPSDTFTYQGVQK